MALYLKNLKKIYLYENLEIKLGVLYLIHNILFNLKLVKKKKLNKFTPLLNFIFLSKKEGLFFFNLKQFISFYTIFWFGLKYKSLFIRTKYLIRGYKGLKESLGSLYLLLLNSLIINNFVFSSLKLVKAKESGYINTLKKLKFYSIFLFKFVKFKRLSFIIQYFFKLSSIPVSSLSFFNNNLSISWDPVLRFNVSYFFFRDNFKQIFNFKKFLFSQKVLLKKINITFFINFFISTILFFSGNFSFGYKYRSGKDNLINFTLFFRKIYLKRFSCLKNLVWLHIRSKKKLNINFFLDFLNFFKYESLNTFYSLLGVIKDNFSLLKIFLIDFYSKGLSDKRSKIKFIPWFSGLFDLSITHNYFPLTGKNSLFSMFFLTFSVVSFNYDFLKFLYLNFKDLDKRFNFNGLPGLNNLQLMLEKLNFRKNTNKLIWTKPLSMKLKRKYKKLRVWRLWRDFKNLIINNKVFTLKNYIKSNKVFLSYYLKFFGLYYQVKHLRKKKLKILDFFTIIESRIDITLYRLGFLHDLYYLRKSIKLGWFFFSNYRIYFIGYFVPLNVTVQPILKASIILLKQFNILKKNLSFWFKTKLNYLAYLEVNFSKLAFIFIRKPRFGEITYINGFNKFTKKRFPLFENIKNKHYLFSREKYSIFFNAI